jgi:hypothetical protein
VTQQADLVIYNPEGEMVLAAEVKNRIGTSRAWAMHMRRNLLAHGMFPQSRFLLLALPDRLYLWDQAGGVDEWAEPTYELDGRSLLQGYYEGAHATPDTISSQSFELIVVAWLNELILSGESAHLSSVDKQALARCGFLAALKDANIAISEPA